MTRQTSSVARGGKPGAGIEQYLGALSDADIRLLRIFSIVVAAGGLSAATTELQADLSAVSRHVKDLEQRVGARLCNRGRSGFALTAHGQLVHKAAQELFLALKAFQDQVNTLHADPVGLLRLGVMDALISDPQFPLSEALRKFKAKAPRVQVQLSVAKPDQIGRAVLTGDLDLGVVVARERMAGLRYHQLYLEKSSLYCAEPHPLFRTRDDQVRLADAAALELVEDPYTESLPLRGPAAAFRKGAVADTIEAAALLIRTGAYVGFLPEHYAAALAPFVRLRAIRPDLFSYQQGIELVHRKAGMSPLARALLDQLGIAPSRL